MMISPSGARPRSGDLMPSGARSLESLVEIRTSFGTQAAAAACAARLVTGRFAACVQVDGPLQSVYRWRNEMKTAEEWRCTCKTAPDREAACVEAIISTHEYETPELIVAHVSCSVGYAAWVRESVVGT